MIELDLTDNPITQTEDYREIVFKILPGLKSLDRIPISSSSGQRTAPLGLKRAEIEDAVGKFLVDKIAPKSKELSFNTFNADMTSPIRKGTNEFNLQSNITIIEVPQEDSKRQGMSFGNFINNSQSNSKQKDSKSVNYSMGSLKTPLVDLEDSKKKDESGIFTFISNKGIDPSTQETKDALQEIINIQEEYIKKKTQNMSNELLKNWRNKVFELLFQNKRAEIHYTQKFNSLEKDNIKILDELDNSNYMLARTKQELDA